MAEVLDVITRLSYEADTKGLDQSIKSIENEISSINQQYKSIERLQVLRARTDKENISQINRINQAIDNRMKKIAQLTRIIENEVRSNASLANSLARAGLAAASASDRLDRLPGVSNAANRSLIDLGRILQDLPYGFIGIANNINPALEGFQRLRQESGSNRAALSALGKSIIGGGGLGLAISVVTSLLVVFGDKLFSTKKQVDDNAKAVENFNRETKELGASVGEEVAKLRVLLTAATNVKNSYEGRLKAVDELQQQYPDYFANMNKELILTGKIGDAYQRTVEAILQRMRVKQQEAKLDSLIADRFATEEKLRDFSTGKAFDYNGVAEDLRRHLAKLNEDIDRVQVNLEVLTTTDYVNPPKKEKKPRTPKERKDALRANVGLPDDPDLDKIVSDFRETQLLLKAAEEAAKKSGSRPGFLPKETTKEEADSIAESIRLYKENQKEQEKIDKEADDKRKKNIELTKQYAKQAADYIISTIQQIYSTQISLLDQEITIRRDRIQQAVELAEKGNSEILKSEQERLDAAQKKREEIAKKQLQINALLQASSAAIAATQAIQTVTNAGASGDPYSTAARIAAAVAALAAGFSFVTNLVNAFKVDSFKDGVIDYQGRGTETSDSNMVRISRGESVMTAKATRENKPVLELMNKGVPIHYTMPYPHVKNESKGLEKHLKELVDAYKSGNIYVKTQVSNGQIATIVEAEKSWLAQQCR